MQRKTAEKPEAQSVTSKVQPEECQINLSDFALFLSVMKVKEAYEDVLSIILDEADLQLKEVKAEQVILNKSGKRAIRLDAWALDIKDRQFDVEMQNDTESDDIRKRSRFYQGLIDTPILKAGRETRYKHLPSTVIIFITQDDIFGKDLAKYTFSEQCEEVANLPLEDGTKKIFLNMSSLNGRAELVSLLQYMKNTTLDNPNIIVKDERILDLDRIVGEIKQSEEWEAVRMSILSIGLQQGREQGLKEGRQEGLQQGLQEGLQQGLQEGLQQGLQQGISETLVKNVEAAMKNFDIDLQKACEGLGITVEEYENARKKIEYFKENESFRAEHITCEDGMDDEDSEMGSGFFFP